MDEYLKLLLEQIRCTKARPYIKQELQDHMEDQIAENMQGFPEKPVRMRQPVLTDMCFML